MGLCLRRHGPRAPELTERQETQVLELLRTGMGTRRVANQLGLRDHAVRAVVSKNHFRHKVGRCGHRYKLSASKRAAIIDEIVNRRNFGLHLAWKYRVSYKMILRIAHEVLNVSHFRNGYREPFLS